MGKAFGKLGRGETVVQRFKLIQYIDQNALNKMLYNTKHNTVRDKFFP